VRRILSNLCHVVPMLALAACAGRVSTNREEDRDGASEATGLGANSHSAPLVDAGQSAEAVPQLPQQGTIGALPPRNPERERHLNQCGEISRQALRIVIDAAASTDQCMSDVDCRAYSAADLLTCWDSCGTQLGWGSPVQESVVRQAISSVPVQSACTLFFESGCQVIPSGCPYIPPGRRCAAHVCVE
jgi:hypothetical protein